jgi:glycosyltransferase involved in cell wall biosynthesis
LSVVSDLSGFRLHPLPNEFQLSGFNFHPLSSNPQPSTLKSLKGLRVCFVAGTLGQGGAERQLYYLLRTLRDAGACAKVLSLSAGEFWETPIRDLGFEISHVGGSSSRLKRLVRIGREARSFKPHIVQAQHFYVNLYAAVTARLFGCREIGAIRNDVISELANVGGPLSRASVRWPRVLAANSRAAVRNLVTMGVAQSRLFFLPNVIGNSHFAPGPAPPTDAFVILCVGRLVAQKRFDLFLQALAQVSLKFPVKGIIAGDGPLRAELEAQAGRLGLLPGRVEFIGRVPDVRELYRRAHLLLLPSDHEGTPNVVLEAMASGVPVVGTRVGDMPDLLGEGSRGRLVAPGDLAGLVSETSKLMYDAQARASLACKARAYVQSNHSDTALKDRLVELYSLVLAT